MKSIYLKRSWKLVTAGLMIGLFFTVQAQAVDLYVTPTGIGDCSSSANACQLQAALTLAKGDGVDDTLLLETGTYDASSATFDYSATSSDTVTLSGGWNSNHTVQSDDETLTMLDGGDTTRVINIEANVVTLTFELINLTIQNGKVDYGLPGEIFYGAGLRAFQSGDNLLTLNVNNCLFQQNKGEWDSVSIPASTVNGGGMYANCDFTITDSRFLNNQAVKGGAIWIVGNDTVDPVIDNCLFEGNKAGDESVHGWDGQIGSAIYFVASPVIKNSIFTGPVGDTSPALATRVSTGELTLTNCVFSGFHSTHWGGALYLDDVDTVLTNCLFFNNSGSNGGAVTVTAEIDDNGTVDDVKFVNCTFANNNDSSAKGGAIYNKYQNLTVVNSIFWDNGSRGLYNDATNPGLTTSVSYSDIQGGVASTNMTNDGNNLAINPQFTTNKKNDPPTAGYPYYLTTGSSCIDAGSNAENGESLDLAGETRVQDGNGDGTAIINMGCYEQVIESFPWILFNPAMTGMK